jgi:hypothetical protein
MGGIKYDTDGLLRPVTKRIADAGRVDENIGNKVNSII